MLTGMELMSCPNQAVAAEVMHHIVHVESNYNPYAIGVVGGQLERQPQNLEEAIATAQMLESKGYNYSLGVAQVNRNNLARYGLDTFAKAFNPCLNLAAGSQILNQCYVSSGNDWGKAFSCYYSGDFVTGFRQGYVQKIFDSMTQGAQGGNGSPPIPLQSIPNGRFASSATPITEIVLPPKDSPAYRQAIRSSLIDSAASSLVSAAAADLTKRKDADPALASGSAAQNEAPQSIVETTANKPSKATDQERPKSTAADDSIFVPKVTRVGGNDSSQTDVPTGQSLASEPVAAPAPTQPVASSRAGDPADLRKSSEDTSFVF